MKYIFMNYSVIRGISIPSEPMEYDELIDTYRIRYKNACRGLCDFPVVIDENGNEVDFD